MPRALKAVLHFVFGLAIMVAFMYPRMAPMIRQSRAIKKAQLAARPAPRSAGQGTAQSRVPSEPLDRIVSFASDVTLRKDATLEIREEFVAHSEGDYFRYGMVRDLPIDSKRAGTAASSANIKKTPAFASKFWRLPKTARPSPTSRAAMPLTNRCALCPGSRSRSATTAS